MGRSVGGALEDIPRPPAVADGDGVHPDGPGELDPIGSGLRRPPQNIGGHMLAIPVFEVRHSIGWLPPKCLQKAVHIRVVEPNSAQLRHPSFPPISKEGGPWVVNLGEVAIFPAEKGREDEGGAELGAVASSRNWGGGEGEERSP